MARFSIKFETPPFTGKSNYKFLQGLKYRQAKLEELAAYPYFSPRHHTVKNVRHKPLFKAKPTRSGVKIQGFRLFGSGSIWISTVLAGARL